MAATHPDARHATNTGQQSAVDTAATRFGSRLTTASASQRTPTHCFALIHCAPWTCVARQSRAAGPPSSVAKESSENLATTPHQCGIAWDVNSGEAHPREAATDAWSPILEAVKERGKGDPRMCRPRQSHRVRPCPQTIQTCRVRAIRALSGSLAIRRAVPCRAD